jgi:serine protease AprX
MSACLLTLAVLVATQLPFADFAQVSAGTSAGGSTETALTPRLADLAARHPSRDVEVIVQLEAGTQPASTRELITRLGGRVTGELHIISALTARMTAGAAQRLAQNPNVRAVSLNAKTKPQTLVNFDPNKMATAFNQSVRASNLWDKATGKGVGVAVIDTGIAGDLPDFRTSQSDPSSRVVTEVVTNPYATTLNDTYGHGTHVAGLIAGNGGYRASNDKLRGKYAGSAPNANLISIKASDDEGNATVLDAIYGLQFAVDAKDNYNIRVVNLSLESREAQSYKTDPLDAAVEAAWFNGIVVVAAAGNRGDDSDAVNYAPGNDPYAISVGAVDDKGTKDTKDDARASWSSAGTTQDGFAKPDFYAPGAHIVSTLSPGSEFSRLCPTCVKDGQYIQAGGTSMSAPIVSGAVASILEKRPNWTPDQVKGALVHTLRSLPSRGKELDALDAYNAGADKLYSNRDLTPNTLIDPASGGIDYTRSSWSRSRWSRSSWSRSSWSCDCSLTDSGSIDPTRSSWSRSSWSTNWSL